MTRRNIIIIIVVVLILLVIVIYSRSKKASAMEVELSTSSTNSEEAMRLPTDSPKVTTLSETPIYLDNIVGFDEIGNIITSVGKKPTTTKEIATITSRTIPSGTIVDTLEIAFLENRDGLTHKYYKINNTDYVLSDYVKLNSK